MKMISGKKGQAALEFLTTYGWALLIIVVMVGALVSFGVFSPTSKGNSCISSTGLVCIDSQISATTGVKFALTNGLGDINSMEVNVTRLNTGVIFNNCLIKDGSESNTITSAVSGQRIIIVCSNTGIEKGTQEAFDALITYNKQNGAFPQTSKVSLSGVTTD